MLGAKTTGSKVRKINTPHCNTKYYTCVEKEKKKQHPPLLLFHDSHINTILVHIPDPDLRPKKLGLQNKKTTRPDGLNPLPPAHLRPLPVQQSAFHTNDISLSRRLGQQERDSGGRLAHENSKHSIFHTHQYEIQ